MKECKKIKKLLVDFSVDELNFKETGKVKKHLDDCLSCTREFNSIKKIIDGVQVLDQESAKISEAHDWEQFPSKIVHTKHSQDRISSHGFYLKPSGWKILVPVLGSFFIMGIITGYLLFYKSSKEDVIGKSAFRTASLAKIETTLAKKEVGEYFKQSQLIITDLMKQCSLNETMTWKNQDNIKRIKLLLTKSRYFNQNLNNPQLLSTQILLEKIEWLLFELLIIDKDVSCEKLQHLQKFIQKERLLFKIRLIEKELFLSEV